MIIPIFLVLKVGSISDAIPSTSGQRGEPALLLTETVSHSNDQSNEATDNHDTTEAPVKVHKREYNHAKNLSPAGVNLNHFNAVTRRLGGIKGYLNPAIPELEPTVKECVTAHKVIFNNGLLRLGLAIRKAKAVRNS